MFGPPAFLFLFYGIVVPALKIFSTPKIRKFAISWLKNIFKCNFISQE
jgi:hypothetical protein